jgi:membrane-bound ClpP family serine protease
MGFMFLIVLLAITGLVCVFLEFFLPGMIFAIAGAAALVASISFFFVAHAALWNALYLLVLLLMLFMVCKMALRWIKKDKDQLYLSNNQEGYVAAQYDHSAVGKEGIAFTELKPAGHVLIEGKQSQALCETGYAPKGATVRVVGGKGGHLLVREDHHG